MMSKCVLNICFEDKKALLVFVEAIKVTARRCNFQAVFFSSYF